MLVEPGKELRAQIKKAAARELAKTTALHLPPAKLTTDNATMIGVAGYLNFAKRKSADASWRSIRTKGNLKM